MTDWMGKKVFVILKNKREYTGKVENVYIDNFLIYFNMTGKFGELLTFPLSEIKIIQEEREKH